MKYQDEINKLESEAFALKARFNAKIEKEAGESLRTQIELQMSTVTKENFLPYTTLIQSSGFGKTRQLEILARHPDYHVVYCNLDSTEKFEQSYPWRTDPFAYFLIGSIKSREDLENRFYHYFKEFLNFIIEKEEEERTLKRKKTETIDDSILKLPLFSFTGIEDSTKKEHDPNRNQVWDKLKQHLNVSNVDISNIWYLKRIVTERKVIFAFDKSRCLDEKKTGNLYLSDFKS